MNARHLFVLAVILVSFAGSGVDAGVRMTTDQQNQTGLGDTLAWDLSNTGTAQAEIVGSRVGWLFHQDGSDDIGDGSDRTAVTNAWQTIDLVGLSTIAGSDLGDTTIKALTDDGSFPIFWWETSNTAPGGVDLTGAVALAVVLVDTVAPERGEIIDANIVFNGFANTFTTTGAAGAFDIEKIALHEIIHTLAGDHTPNMAATMYTTGNFADGALGSDRSLSADDIALLGATYPRAGFASATGSLTGKVTDSGGGNVFGAHVVAMNSAGIAVGGALTQGDGIYNMQGLAPGSYSVFVDPLDNDTDAFFADGFYLFSRQELVSLGYYEANGLSPDINTGFKTSGPHATSVSPGGATTLNVSLASGSQTVDVELTGDCNTFFHVLPRTFAQGSVGNVIAVAGRAIPQAGTPLSITGAGITITNTTFSANTFPFPCTLLGSTAATDLFIIQITFDIAANAAIGPRTLVVDSGTQKAIVTGGIEILEAPQFCPDTNEPNDSQAQPTPIACLGGGPGTTPARPTCVSSPTDEDWYVFEAPPLTSVTITAFNGSAFPEDLTLLTPNGLPLAAVSGPDATIYNQALPGPGPYLIRVAAPFGGGPYQLNLQCKPACPNPGWQPIGWAGFDTDEFVAPIAPMTVLDNEYRTANGLDLLRTGVVDLEPLVAPVNQVMANHDSTTGLFLRQGTPAEGKVLFAFTDPTQGLARQTASCVSMDVGNTLMTPPGTMIDAIGYDPNGAPIAMAMNVPTGGQIQLVSPFPPPNSIATVEVTGPGGGPIHFAIDNVSATLDLGASPLVCSASATITAINGTSFCTGTPDPVFDLSTSTFGGADGCAGLAQIGLFDVRWFLDGAELPGETFPVLDLTPYALAPGSYTVDAVMACPFDDMCLDDTRVSGGTVAFDIGTAPLIGNSLRLSLNPLDEPVFEFNPAPGAPPSQYSVVYDTVAAGPFASTSASGASPPLTESPALTGNDLYYYLARAGSGSCAGPPRCTETLEPQGPGGDFWQVTATGPTTLTVAYTNNDDTGTGFSNALVALEVFDAGCGGSLNRFEFNADCDYPVDIGPGNPECPLATVSLPGAGTYCFLVQPITPPPFSHCYGLRVEGDPPIGPPTLIGDDF